MLIDIQCFMEVNGWVRHTDITSPEFVGFNFGFTRFGILGMFCFGCYVRAWYYSTCGLGLKVRQNGEIWGKYLSGG